MNTSPDISDLILAVLGDRGALGLTVDELVELARAALGLGDLRFAVEPALEALFKLEERGHVEITGHRVSEYRVRLPLGELVA